MRSSSLLPAAQYLRMSTEHQRYSMQNQVAAIAAYAQARGFQIVGTYQDPGRSGLTLSGRPGLQRLLADVVAPDRPFEAILVLDVSRWGRFQDADQAAHYEFICRAAGVAVHYCAEPFDNDGALSSMIIKHLKRLMAAEYSRELSSRVVRAQLQQAQLGFKQGGGRAYGVRRVLVDETGKVRLELEDGQRKAMARERVVLVRGPPHEVRTIQRIFHLYVRERRTIGAIAELLNSEAIPSNQGQPWTYWRVRCVLASEFALGNYVFNRASRRLQGRQVQNPPASWVRVRVMPPIVSESLFAAAAARMAAGRPQLFSDGEMLKRLARLYKQHGYLSTALIDACSYTPAAVTYRLRFGSLSGAYDKLGFVRSIRWRATGLKPATDEEMLEILRSLHRRHGKVTSGVIKGDPTSPSVETFQDRFGSLTRAYHQAGIPTRRAPKPRVQVPGAPGGEGERQK
ncbi:recombinase family protein [Phenylobacterium sp. J426]|uniref:recombinase family protein n=1 Tax=Phenylobacterium sp. J426 TaxID=2898439 RepID=UPI0021515EDC|nr:recombinase family protein [Phenylobacterium sp. J426]MCR5876620.1 recombinase family protein [Phenylobacterium sp. J426]